MSISPSEMLAAIIGAIVLLVAAILLAFRLVSKSDSSPTSRVAIAYFLGLVVYCGVLYLGSEVNPHDTVHGHWSDPYFQVLTALAFLCCLVMPLRLPIPWLGRVAVSLLSLLVLTSAFWRWYIVTA